MTSTSSKAHIAGFLYFLFALLGPFLLVYVPGALVVGGNPLATATNIQTHETLLRLGIAADVVCGVLALAVAFALCRRFETVDKMQAVPVSSSVVSCRDELVMLFMRLHHYGV